MSELLFTGQVPIPDVAGSLDKTSQILQNVSTLRAKQQALQAQRMKEATAQRSKLMSRLYGKGLSDLHESAIPFAREALDKAAMTIAPLLSSPTGAVEAERIMRNTFDSIDRYADSEAWHNAEQKASALIDPNSAEYREEVKGMKFFRPNVTAESVAAQSRRARGGDVTDMELKFNADGSFNIMGTDVGADGVTDIAAHSWFNQPGNFQYGVSPVSVRDSQAIGQSAGAEHKKLKKSSSTVKSYVLKNQFENGTLPVEFENLRAEDPKFEIRVNAFLRDRDDIMNTFNISDQEDLFALYEFKDPLLMDETAEGGFSTLGQRLRRSIEDEAKRISEAAYYPPEDADGANLEELRKKAYESGVASEEQAPSILPGLPDTQETRDLATFNLRGLESKAFDEITVMVPNPEYDAYVEEYGGEDVVESLAAAGLRVPPKKLAKKIEGFTLRKDMPNIFEIDIFGSDEKKIIDLNDTELSDEDRILKGLLQSAFSKTGLSWDGFQERANQLWSDPSPEESVSPGTEDLKW